MAKLGSELSKSSPDDFLNGSINFVGHTSNQPARFVVVDKDDTDVSMFADNYLPEHLDLSKKPKVMLSVTGGAQEFKMLSSKLEQVFTRGIIRAAQSTDAWIVTGALDDGVMKFVGDAMRSQGAEEVPCIGIATYKKVTHYETLRRGPEISNYSKQKPNSGESAALNPDHTHFILVDSKKDVWGEEIGFRSALEDHLSQKWEIPIVLIVVNGGPGTLRTVAEGVEKGFPVIVVEGSGRCADALAAKIKFSSQKAVLPIWENFIGKNEAARKTSNELADKIMARQSQISLFNPNADAAANMDVVILRSILNCGNVGNFQAKLQLCVEWNRADLIRELLDKDDSASEDKTEALKDALQLSLESDKPEIFSLLMAQGAKKEMLQSKKLYELEDIKYSLSRLKPFMTVDTDEEEIPLDAAIPGGKRRLNVARSVLRSVNSMYVGFVDDNKISFTDVMVWAIIADRQALAQAIWKQTGLPIHTALVACHLYKTIGVWLQDEEDYNEYAAWYEEKAIAILDATEFETGKDIMRRPWATMQNKTPLEIAQIASCKDFLSHTYVQRYFGEQLYSCEKGEISPGTPIWKIVMAALFPVFGVFSSIYKPKEGVASRFWHVYDIPVVRMCTSTICYLMFLCVLSATVILTGTMDYHPIELVLVIFYFAAVIEEVKQFLSDRDTYFDLLSNRIDCVMYFLILIYIGLRVAGVQLGNKDLIIAATDVIMIANIVCYLRLLNVFAFSKELGPLFFVILRLFKDVFQWCLIYALFMISFQIAFIAVTAQAAETVIDAGGSGAPNKWDGYPTGTLGLSFFTIIGDYGYANDINAQSAIGIPLIAIYALVAQVMLVNLLIAMMGDTYSDVYDNSTKEWKFYRMTLVEEYSTSSVYPPPFNLIFVPLSWVQAKLCGSGADSNYKSLDFAQHPLQQNNQISNSTKRSNLNVSVDSAAGTPVQTKRGGAGPSSAPVSATAQAKTDLTVKMKVAKERVLEQIADEEESKIENVTAMIQENLKLLLAQQEIDRYNTQTTLEDVIQTIAVMKQHIDIITNRHYQKA
eukprot:TRINITY_DN1962_c0_g1_i2.p1 TRINITY_DN1962_c0_g1~~TRINITY_DN1962_c0_g1_i2.p1  ORF type:complete len:1043 (+),score=331.07 TRINITY_DN1962_c0_g1_i2:218-3346(+)